MKFATYVTEVSSDDKISIPRQVREKLRIEMGDRVEVSLKKIKSKRIDLLLSENPLYRLLDLPGSDREAE